MHWGDDVAHATVRPDTRVAAERRDALARLRWFDTHRWQVHRQPAQWWICTDCLLPIEATGTGPCTWMAQA
jgi:hypothetical protein